ncbi:MAG TPA: DUF3558 family protein [Polyangia bacterium]|nr:DUF3558 family protein [Polyangia bacterium]
MALGLTAAACGSSSPSPGSPADATTSAADGASSSDAASPATDGPATPIVVCDTLSTSQVASLSGIALTHSREQDFAADNAYTCSYFTDSGFGGLAVTVNAVGGATAYANTLQTDTIEGAAENVTPLTGIGDKAFSATDGVHVLYGDRMISVDGLQSVQPAEAIVEALQAMLK